MGQRDPPPSPRAGRAAAGRTSPASRRAWPSRSPVASPGRAADGVAEVADGVRWLDAHVLHGDGRDRVRPRVSKLLFKLRQPPAHQLLWVSCSRCPKALRAG